MVSFISQLQHDLTHCTSQLNNPGHFALKAFLHTQVPTVGLYTPELQLITCNLFIIANRFGQLGKLQWKSQLNDKLFLPYQILVGRGVSEVWRNNPHARGSPL